MFMQIKKKKVTFAQKQKKKHKSNLKKIKKNKNQHLRKKKNKTAKKIIKEKNFFKNTNLYFSAGWVKNVSIELLITFSAIVALTSGLEWWWLG